MMYKNVNGERIAMSESEIAEFNAEKTAWENESKDRKLAQIKQMRLEKLIETDYYALQDVTMSNEMKTWRQNLRDIPTNYTDEAAYDLLLTRDKNGNLTHSVWSKP